MLLPAVEEPSALDIFQRSDLFGSRRLWRGQTRLLLAYTDANGRLDGLQLQLLLRLGLVAGLDGREVIVVEDRCELDVCERILAPLVAARARCEGGFGCHSCRGRTSALPLW